jgi:cytoplasmic iron level regulating protein YaaA (DUF328/UPF0246 family)
MARFIIQNQITDVENIKNFDLDGYKFKNDNSEENKLVFVR